MIKNMLLGGIAAFLRTEKILNNPLNVQVEPTTFCNLKCKMCIRNDKVTTPLHTAENTLRLAVKKLSPSRIVFAGAGEPLLNPELPEMIRFCVQSRIKTMLSTNLVSDHARIDGPLKAGIHVIKVSIDAPDRDTYAFVRGKADYFDTVIENVKYILAKKPGMDLRFEYVIMKENLEKIPAMLTLAASLGINRLYFRELQTEGINEERRKQLMEKFDLARLKKILLDSEAAARKLKLRTNLPALVRNFNDLVDVYSREVPPDAGASCLLPWLQIFVAANGDVSPCCALYTNSGIKSGSIIDNNRDEILNGTAMVCIRRGFKNKKLAPVCRDCIPRDFRKLFVITRSQPGY